MNGKHINTETKEKADESIKKIEEEIQKTKEELSS
jgi:hypothetical protein